MAGMVLLLAMVGTLAALGVMQIRTMESQIQQLRMQTRTMESQIQQLQRQAARPGSHPDSRARPARRPQRRTVPEVLVTVAGLDYTFDPRRLVVTQGTTVRWISKTREPHSVTSARPRLFSVIVNGYRSVSIRFAHPGSFPYYCIFHPYMRGVIVVQH